MNVYLTDPSYNKFISKKNRRLSRNYYFNVFYGCYSDNIGSITSVLFLATGNLLRPEWNWLMTVVIQVYAATSNEDGEELEQPIGTSIRQCENLMGNFGLAIRNEIGERSTQFCQEKDFMVTNTYYDWSTRIISTWRSLADNQNTVISNQIDDLFINGDTETQVS